jgi:type I restriction enzyme, S subunit
LGLIPKGWRVGKLGEVCELAYGKGLKSEYRIEGEFPVVGSNGIVGAHNEYLVEGPGIVIGRKGTIGEVIWLHQNFFPIDTTFYIKDLLGVSALYFHYFLLKEQDFKKIGSDSAVPGLNRNQAYDNIVVIPSLDVINQFNEIMVSVFESIYNNEQQSATLASLRNALLPKLMSGEIEV